MVSTVSAIPFVPQNVDTRSSRKRDLRFLLRDYLIGPENQLLATAIASIQEHGLQQWSPLVLVGPRAVGKSHLAYGLAGFPTTSTASATVVSSIDFARAYANAALLDETSHFLRKQVEPSLLVIDDINNLAKKLAAQLCLVRILDQRCQAAKDVIVTAPDQPDRLKLIPELASRLMQGLVLSVEPAGIDTRAVALQRFADHKNIAITEEAAEHLAKRLPLSLPELSLSLNELSRQFGSPISLKAVQAFTEQHLQPAKPPKLNSIYSVVAKQCRIRVGDLRGPSRKKGIALARKMAVYLARVHTSTSLQDIGRSLGGRDHSTVLHAYRSVCENLPHDRALQSAIDDLTNRITSA